MTDNTIETFIERWSNAGGSERANYQLFLTQLCSLLGVPEPEPASDSTRDNAYVFERRVIIKQPDGRTNSGFIDLYRRGSFVLEAKQTSKALDSGGWDKAMLRAHNQADQYVRALPNDEGRPPFIVVVDVGRNIELYAEFSKSGATYTPFPDARSHRVRLSDLRQEHVRERLRAVWLDPLSLDPARRSARVTRKIADQLARLARSVEATGEEPQKVAAFLMRAIFTMFAEDIGLLPERAFTELLRRLEGKPQSFVPMMENLWQTMNTGGFSPIFEHTLLRFNGGLFADSTAVSLDRDQLQLLRGASEADWRYVEPAIFGTLLERALDPQERHKLGAHFTPRAYVERLVLPTVIEPLRDEWKEVQAAALTYVQQNKSKQAIEEVRSFHRHLCTLQILDPACGSGNFLYVTLEHMKRLEGEVLNVLHDLGESQGLLELEGVTVDPHQFLGLEINPRAAKIAEMVLWIGYLQWHFRTHGTVNPPQPVLRDFQNIKVLDALIAHERKIPTLDDKGEPVTRWDGTTYKLSPVTGEQIPDEAARTGLHKYIDPKKSVWPKADYIVGNPPFIGSSTMRRSLGDGYVDAVRRTWSDVPESADFVMYWWHIAAEKVRAGEVKQFGFITTNSIRQTFNRRLMQYHLVSDRPMSLAFAIPDHPWVDSADGAAVRIAMTVGVAGEHEGRLLEVRSERRSEQDEIDVTLKERSGLLYSDLSAGANVGGCLPLRANAGISSPGVKLHGAGFIVTPDEAAQLGLGEVPAIENVIRSYRNGRDLAQSPRGVKVIDLYGLEAETVRKQYPTVYQRILEQVKPERDQNNRASYKKNWWVFGEPRREWRACVKGLPRYIATVETTKHRVFHFLDSSILPDNMLICIASNDASLLGVLSSRLHATWALAAGGRLGVGNDPRYNKTRCFDPFPFPVWFGDNQRQIGELGSEIDAHRKKQQSLNAGLTITAMYNVLEAIRSGRPLTEKERVIHECGLLSILRELHDSLDRLVFEAYSWGDLADELVGKPGATIPLQEKTSQQTKAEEELLRRLVELNASRVSEESHAKIHWLRPDFQNPSGETATHQFDEQVGLKLDEEILPTGTKANWPKNMREQVAAVRNILSRERLTSDLIASRFKKSPKQQVSAVLEALVDLGLVSTEEGEYHLLG